MYVNAVEYGVLFEFCFFFFKQKTAYEMRISDWSSDVCSSDLAFQRGHIKGAVNLPLTDFTAESLAEVIGRDPNRPILIYCNNNFSNHQSPEIGRASCRERVCQYV